MTRSTARISRRLVSAVATAAVAVLLVTACATDSDDNGATPTPSASSAPESPAPEMTAVAIPETPVGERVQWIVDLLNHEADVTEVDLEGAFDALFIDAVPLSDLATLLNVQIRPAAPIVVTGYEGTETQAIAQASGVIGEPFAIQLSITADGLIDGFALTPATTPDRAESLGEVADRLAALPITVNYYATITPAGGDTTVVLDHNAEKAAPVASIFKLYVLLAVQHEVAAGTLTWDELLTVSDANRSLPSGTLQDEPDGTTVSVRDAATAMISISDNTATDMLIERVGRDAVERAVVDAGHHDPLALQPFLTTREMFALAFASTPDVQRQWAGASVAERRAMLDTRTIDLAAIDIASLTPDAFWMNRLDWFASPVDIAAAHTALAALNDADITAALTKNPGIALDPAQWSEIAYKGGSSLGVLSGSWRVQAVDGTVTTLVMLASADDATAVAAAQMEIFSLAADVIRLAG